MRAPALGELLGREGESGTSIRDVDELVSGHASDEIKSAHSQVAWREISGIRVILAHAYFHIGRGRPDRLQGQHRRWRGSEFQLPRPHQGRLTNDHVAARPPLRSLDLGRGIRSAVLMQ